MAYGYWRGYFTINYAIFITKLIIFISSGFVFAMITRGIGRSVNEDYKKFIIEYLNAKNSISKDTRKRFLCKYDFDVSKWSPDYIASIDPPVL